MPVVPIPRPEPAVAAVSAWLLVKAFSSGCTAMTGVEAVSNGVPAFRDPKVKNAQATLKVMIATLILLLGGIAYLCRVYDIGATQQGQPGYQSVLSQITLAVTGRGVFYFITMAAVLTVLALSANTSFADFPRLCRAIAEDQWLPDPFTIRGRRLVYSFGVYVLAFLAASLLIAFEGVTDRLIPLFAVGAFIAFTLSQAGKWSCIGDERGPLRIQQHADQWYGRTGYRMHYMRSDRGEVYRRRMDYRIGYPRAAVTNRSLARSRHIGTN